MFGMGNRTPNVSIMEIDSLLGKINLIDVREPYECATGILDTAKNIPVNVLLMAPENFLKKSETYHIVCHSGSRSGQACAILAGAGYDVVNVVGGMGRYGGNRIKR